MKELFDQLRKISGVLTQEQVDATNILVSKTSTLLVETMLGLKNKGDSLVNNYKTSDDGVVLLVSLEGMELKAYPDSGGIYTVGIGTIKYPDGKPVKKGDVITKEQAISYMKHDLEKFEGVVNTSVLVKLNQQQFDALVSLTYNIGSSAFKNSTLLKMLNSGQYKVAADQFLRWNKVNGKEVKGLTNRRVQERLLFLS